MDDRNILQNGWAFDPANGSTYHFEHFPMTTARKMAEARDALYVLETINWTYADRDPKTCHLNKYFAMGFPTAIALAAQMEIERKDIAEDLVGIRVATDEEAEMFWRAYDHFDRCMPAALSDEEAAALPSGDGDQ